MSFLRIAAAYCVLTVISLAAEPQAKPDRCARLLAVGESPPFRQEIREGVRYELDPPPDSIPPREVIPGFGKESGGAVLLSLGRISAPVKVPQGEGILELRKSGENPDSAPWTSVKRPESGDFLVFLFRDPAKKNWKDVASLIVPDGADGAPAGSVRIVNLFQQAARIAWGSEVLILPAGKTLVRTAKLGSETPFQVLVADSSGAMKRYYSGTVTQNDSERSFVIIHRADGFDPRRPLKVFTMREPVVPAVLPNDPGKTKN